MKREANCNVSKCTNGFCSSNTPQPRGPFATPKIALKTMGEAVKKERSTKSEQKSIIASQPATQRKKKGKKERKQCADEKRRNEEEKRKVK